VSLVSKIPEVIVNILPAKGEAMETATIQTAEFETTQPTDPREAKLKEIIEKWKASLQKTLEEIQHEFAIREDMAVRPSAPSISSKPPWILTRYRYNQNLIKGLTNPGLFKPPVDIGRLLSRGIG
jgi:hypothetical protein